MEVTNPTREGTPHRRLTLLQDRVVDNPHRGVQTQETGVGSNKDVEDATGGVEDHLPLLAGTLRLRTVERLQGGPLHLKQGGVPPQAPL